jgi:hypothetical protein
MAIFTFTGYSFGMKPTVYIETTVVGHLTSRLPSDVVVVAQMLETRRWWSESRQDFDLFISAYFQPSAYRRCRGK